MIEGKAAITLSKKFSYKAWQTRQWRLKNGPVVVVQEATKPVPESNVIYPFVSKLTKRERQTIAARQALERSAKDIG